MSQTTFTYRIADFRSPLGEIGFYVAAAGDDEQEEAE